MEHEIINNNYYIKNNRLYVNNLLVKTLDVIKYNCTKCESPYKRKYTSKSGTLLICKKCKMKQTKLEKYGNENYNNRKKMKQTKLEKYGNACYVNPLKAKQTKLEKYGNENYNNNKKTVETNLKRYGVKCVFQSKEIIKTIKQTNLEKYNNEYYNNREKIIKTNLKRYGGTSPFFSDNVREKSKQTKLKKYGNIYYNNNTQSKKLLKYRKYLSMLKLENLKPLFTLDEYTGVEYYKEYLWECLKCNTQFNDHIYSKIPRCPTCYPYYKSIGEQNLVNYFKLLNLNIIENDRELISPYEIDIYIPSHNLAIEYNGIYYHSTKFIQDKYYHQRKVELAYRKGVRLLHIWEHEDEDDIKKDIQHYLNNMDVFIEVEKPKLYNIQDNLIWI